ncbi:transcriptional regulator [Lactobacillus selangorensis]|uniref:Transcriptional regulator n=1 Tax=Lactobacillus selangorensis TaxID=81857 RepID=A0A0R2FX91_9LACO|nr:LysR family transcriptional regulator [Lactobacillus selangorensis]KRN28644.1 transcriptional regulator [Lactobacillus selangorensis]KRN32946.1 transcriptional regulator [Lactobacillus selangorensis]
MDFFNVKCFVVTYENQTISAAANQLAITQSALSKRLSKLQAELGVTLFDTRNRRHLVSTPQAAAFYPYATQLLTLDHQARQALHQNQTPKISHLRIGSIPIMAQYGFTNGMQRFMAAHPHIDVRVTEMEGEELLQQLTDKQLNLGIIRADQLPNSTYQQLVLGSDELEVILAQSNPLARQKQIHLDDLKASELVSLKASSGIFDLMSSLFVQTGIELPIRFESTHIETLSGLIANSDRLVTFLFKKSAQPFLNDRVVARPLAKPVTSELLLIYQDDRFAGLAQELAAALKIEK